MDISAIRTTIARVAASVLVLGLGSPAAAQSLEAPEVDTSIDQLTVAPNDLDPTRPERVTWRSTAKVRSGVIDQVADRTLGELRYVDRAQLGDEVDPEYPITIRGRVRTPICDSSESAQWMSGSDFIGRGRSWAGLEGDRIDPFRGYFPSNAPDGSQLQTAELGVGGFDRFPPRPPKAGGHMEAAGFGASFHNMTYLDPAGACWIGGVERVEARVSFGVTALRAVGGDVALEDGQDLPRFFVPVIEGATLISVVHAGGVPGMVVGADTLLVSEEDGSNPQLLVEPYVQNGGTWHESRSYEGGMEWQLRFYVIAYWDAPFATQEDSGTFQIMPGETAIVMQPATGRTERMTATATEPSVLSFGGEDASLEAADPALGPNGTPFPTPNLCGAEPIAGSMQVRGPSRAAEAGPGKAVRSAGVGDPEVPYATPPGFNGARFATDAAGIPTLEQVVVAGREFGSLALPHVRIDGTIHPLTTATRIEGPIVYEHTTSYGNDNYGYTWNSLLIASVHRVADVEIPLYWTIHSKVQFDSRGVGTCGVAIAEVSDVINLADRTVELRWFAGATLEGRPQSFVKQFRIGQGSAVVTQEKVCDRDKPNWFLIDNCTFLDLRDKQDPDERWQLQTVYAAGGYTSMVLHKGTKAADPRTEVNGESIDGVAVGLYLVEEEGLMDSVPDGGYNRDEVFSNLALYLYPCTAASCPRRSLGGGALAEPGADAAT